MENAHKKAMNSRKYKPNDMAVAAIILQPQQNETTHARHILSATGQYH